MTAAPTPIIPGTLGARHGTSPRVDAAATRAHLEALDAAGFGTTYVARATGIAQRVLSDLLHGRKTTITTVQADRIAAVPMPPAEHTRRPERGDRPPTVLERQRSIDVFYRHVATALEARITQAGWRHRAACTGLDPAMFHPDPDADDHDEVARAAKQVCAGCPVRVECGTDNRGVRVEGSIYGGCDPQTRRRRYRRPVAA